MVSEDRAQASRWSSIIIPAKTSDDIKLLEHTTNGGGNTGLCERGHTRRSLFQKQKHIFVEDVQQYTTVSDLFHLDNQYEACGLRLHGKVRRLCQIIQIYMKETNKSKNKLSSHSQRQSLNVNNLRILKFESFLMIIKKVLMNKRTASLIMLIVAHYCSCSSWLCFAYEVVLWTIACQPANYIFTLLDDYNKFQTRKSLPSLSVNSS